MISVLVLTHGNLARELLEAARRIDPQLEEASDALSLPWEIDSDEASKQLKRILRELGGDGGVLILTDMFGGTPSNLAISVMEPGRVEVVAGVNLPMLIKLASVRAEGDLDEAVKAVVGALKKQSTPVKGRKEIAQVAAISANGDAGIGALIAGSIVKSEVIAYEDLGAEAVLRLEVMDFPATVIDDIHGNDLYEEGKAQYRKTR